MHSALGGVTKNSQMQTYNIISIQIFKLDYFILDNFKNFQLRTGVSNPRTKAGFTPFFK